MDFRATQRYFSSSLTHPLQLPLPSERSAAWPTSELEQQQGRRKIRQLERKTAKKMPKNIGQSSSTRRMEPKAEIFDTLLQQPRGRGRTRPARSHFVEFKPGQNLWVLLSWQRAKKTLVLRQWGGGVFEATARAGQWFIFAAGDELRPRGCTREVARRPRGMHWGRRGMHKDVSEVVRSRLPGFPFPLCGKNLGCEKASGAHGRSHNRTKGSTDVKEVKRWTYRGSRSCWRIPWGQGSQGFTKA